MTADVTADHLDQHQRQHPQRQHQHYRQYHHAVGAEGHGPAPSLPPPSGTASTSSSMEHPSKANNAVLHDSQRRPPPPGPPPGPPVGPYDGYGAYARPYHPAAAYGGEGEGAEGGAPPRYPQNPSTGYEAPATDGSVAPDANAVGYQDQPPPHHAMPPHFGYGYPPGQRAPYGYPGGYEEDYLAPPHQRAGKSGRFDDAGDPNNANPSTYPPSHQHRGHHYPHPPQSMFAPPQVERDDNQIEGSPPSSMPPGPPTETNNASGNMPGSASGSNSTKDIERLRAAAATELSHIEVKPIRTDFHFFVDEHKDALLQQAQVQIRAKDCVLPNSKQERFLVNTKVNTSLMMMWERLSMDKREIYMGKEEEDRRRFMEEDEIASRHCATLTARGKSQRAEARQEEKELTPSSSPDREAPTNKRSSPPSGTKRALRSQASSLTKRNRGSKSG